jgi:glutathione S-transferase
MQKAALEYALMRYGFVEKSLGEKPLLAGENFTVADAYLHVMRNWWRRPGLDVTQYPKRNALHARARARSAAQKARADEGLPA